MNMRKKNLHLNFLKQEEPPIEVPPIEEVWPMMRQKLDERMPVRPWHSQLGWRLAIISTISAFTIFLLIPHHSVKQQQVDALKSSLTKTRDSLQQKSTNPSIVSKQPVLKKQTETVKNEIEKEPLTESFRHQENNFSSGKQIDSPESQIVTAPKMDLHYKSTQELSSLNKESFHEKKYPVLKSSRDKKSFSLVNKHRQKVFPDILNNAVEKKSGSVKIESIENIPDRKHDIVSRMHMMGNKDALMKATISSSAFSANYFSETDTVLRTISLYHKNPIQPGISAANDKMNSIVKKKNIPGKKTSMMMTAGLSVKKNFPVGSQQSAPYNVSGGTNTLSDYIPAPYLRYFINDKIYLEAALYFNSPQFTRTQLIDSSSDSSRLIGWQQDLQINRIELQKLYYTEIPLSLHYRLFENFYIGAGIQFSQLWNGIARQTITMHPTNGLGSDTLYSSETVRLKSNNNAYSKIRKTDWRFSIEASYQWKKFTLGVHYQQGLSPYLSLLPDGSAGKAKNASLGIELQYDLWKQMRKK